MKAILLFPALALLAFGCATSASPEPTNMTEAQPIMVSSTSVTPSQGETEATAESLQVGNEVGSRIPGFAINLADGSTVALDELLQDSQPAFLFFFTTW